MNNILASQTSFKTSPIPIQTILETLINLKIGIIHGIKGQKDYEPMKGKSEIEGTKLKIFIDDTPLQTHQKPVPEEIVALLRDNGIHCGYQNNVNPTTGEIVGHTLTIGNTDEIRDALESVLTSEIAKKMHQEIQEGFARARTHAEHARYLLVSQETSRDMADKLIANAKEKLPAAPLGGKISGVAHHSIVGAQATSPSLP